MTLELPYAGPNRTWGIEESFVYPPKGSPLIPKGWKRKRDGRYSEEGFRLALYDVEQKVLTEYNHRFAGVDEKKAILTEEDAKTFLDYSYKHQWHSVGPKMGVVSTNKVTRVGGFLGIGSTKRVEVFQEEQVVGWIFEIRRPGYTEDLFAGFTREDVLTAANKILENTKDTDHDSALLLDSKRHVGFYPPKTLGEQFPT
mgnify:CR=1 FL=1